MPAFEPSPDLPTLPEIARALVDWPGAFSDCKEIPGARVYTQADNPQSHDGNHAYILKSDDFTQVIVDAVTWIYQDLDLTPRVYAAGPGREQQEVAHVLAQAGYRITPASRKVRHFVRPEVINLPVPTGLEVRPLITWDPGLEELFAREPWDHECLAKALKRNQAAEKLSPQEEQGNKPARTGKPDIRVPSGPPAPRSGQASLRLFGAWMEGKLVSVASLTASRSLFCLDHVRTLDAAQGKGYCQALLSVMLNDPSLSDPRRQVIFSDKPAAIHIYQKLGFRALEDANPFWEAVLEGEHRSREPEDLEEGDEDDQGPAGRPAGGQSQNGGSGRTASTRPGAGRSKAARNQGHGKPGNGGGTRKHPGSGGRP